MQIHQYKNNGYNIVLDVPSGSVHVLDDAAYDVLSLINGYVGEKTGSADDDNESGAERVIDLSAYRNMAEAELCGSYTAEEIEESISELQELCDAGVLFTDDEYRPDIEAHAAHETVVKALCLHIAHDCNLRCRYCFADEGEYHGKRELMSAETGKKALDFLVKASGARINLEVDFFGGEPLMNLSAVKEIVSYGRELEKIHNKRFRFTLTTNALLIDDDFIDFANKELGNVVLSLDGRREVHDRMRPCANGKGSYDLVVPKMKKFVEARGERQYYIRGTFTSYNKDFTKDIFHMADLGFKELSMEPVVASCDEPYAIQESDLPEIKEQYDILAQEMIKRKNAGNAFNFFHFMIDLSGGPCVYKRLTGCGSGTEYLAVTPNGDLYPCHQFAGIEDFRLGNVDEGVIRKDITAKFKKLNVYAREECRDCFARFYCSGGCAANSWNFTGSLDGNYFIGCELERKRVECAIMLKAASYE